LTSVSKIEAFESWIWKFWFLWRYSLECKLF